MVLARQLSGWEGILPLSVTVFCPLLVLLSDQARDNNEKKKIYSLKKNPIYRFFYRISFFLFSDPSSPGIVTISCY